MPDQAWNEADQELHTYASDKQDLKDNKEINQRLKPFKLKMMVPGWVHKNMDFLNQGGTIMVDPSNFLICLRPHRNYLQIA